MDWFTDHGFDTWTMDNEGYGRSDKHRDINFDISNGADDLAVGSQYILEKTGAPSTGTLCTASSSAITRTPPTQPRSTPLQTPS
jgi:hypothetical protein